MSHRFIHSQQLDLSSPASRVQINMTTRPNCDYLVSIEWMRYQRQWVPYWIFFASPFDNRQVKIFPNLDSLQSFSYQDIVKNLKHSHSLLEEDENWDHSDIVRVPHDELEQFIKVHLVKDYLERKTTVGIW
ncbi:uncharacterized protein TNCV_1236511 [Trichonephila clavipes]|nr:uncharacterized protein TNCV_1236511 [Trichonephila clavipes]